MSPYSTVRGYLSKCRAAVLPSPLSEFNGPISTPHLDLERVGAEDCLYLGTRLAQPDISEKWFCEF